MNPYDLFTIMQSVTAMQSLIVNFQQGLIQAGFTKAQANKLTTHLFTGGDVKKADLIP